MLGPQDQPIRIGKPEPTRTNPDQLVPDTIVQEAEMHALGHVLGLERQSDLKQYQDQTKRIMDWAKAKGAASLTDIVAEVNSLRSRVGGKDVLSLAVYAGLELERMSLEAKMQKMEAR